MVKGFLSLIYVVTWEYFLTAGWKQKTRPEKIVKLSSPHLCNVLCPRWFRKVKRNVSRAYLARNVEGIICYFHLLWILKSF